MSDETTDNKTQDDRYYEAIEAYRKKENKDAT